MTTKHTDALARILSVLRGEVKGPDGRAALSKIERLAMIERIAEEALGE